MRNQTSDLWILCLDTLPLSHGDSMVSKAHYKVLIADPAYCLDQQCQQHHVWSIDSESLKLTIFLNLFTKVENQFLMVSLALTIFLFHAWQIYCLFLCSVQCSQIPLDVFWVSFVVFDGFTAWKKKVSTQVFLLILRFSFII